MGNFLPKHFKILPNSLFSLSDLIRPESHFFHSFLFFPFFSFSSSFPLFLVSSNLSLRHRWWPPTATGACQGESPAIESVIPSSPEFGQSSSSRTFAHDLRLSWVSDHFPMITTVYFQHSWHLQTQHDELFKIVPSLSGESHQIFGTFLYAPWLFDYFMAKRRCFIANQPWSVIYALSSSI